MLGYAREEDVGRHIRDFYADEAQCLDVLGRLGRNETLHEYEATMVAKDGSRRYVLINSNVYREDGKFVHTRCFTRDITRFRQMMS